MAERVGFEPTLPFRVNTLSKRAPSATRPSLRLKSVEGTTCCNCGACDLPRHPGGRAACRPFDSMGEVVDTATGKLPLDEFGRLLEERGFQESFSGGGTGEDVDAVAEFVDAPAAAAFAALSVAGAGIGGTLALSTTW